MAAPSSQDLDIVLTLQSSHRLTPRISLHTFSIPADSDLGQRIRPSQHVTLQFPPDLDPIAGSRNLNDQERRLVFTPCYLEHDPSGHLRSLVLLAGNGRVTGLLGLPRPHGPLTARLVEAGKGFPEDVANGQRNIPCVAGGTGMACFLAMASGSRWHSEGGAGNSNFLWSIRGDDFAIVEFLLERGMLRVADWSSVQIFITSGDEGSGLTAGKPQSWWLDRFNRLHDLFPGDLRFQLGRITQEDMSATVNESKKEILFCGSKYLEWQVKMWTLGIASVHVTQT
ncbi:hypothetical protein G7046_g3058 [Stylonectria norvegica]|nr:hypothetical protein G7046_g3058 [Stylonectria norvegica]